MTTQLETEDRKHLIDRVTEITLEIEQVFSKVGRLWTELPGETGDLSWGKVNNHLDNANGAAIAALSQLTGHDRVRVVRCLQSLRTVKHIRREVDSFRKDIGKTPIRGLGGQLATWEAVDDDLHDASVGLRDLERHLLTGPEVTT